MPGRRPTGKCQQHMDTRGRGPPVSSEQYPTDGSREQKVRQIHAWLFLLVFEEHLIAKIFLAKN